MPNTPIQFIFAGLPGGTAYCYTTAQRLALDITAGLSGYVPSQITQIINSDTEPDVDNRLGVLWYKTSEGRFYSYDGGWKSPNLADADERRIFVGAESDVWSYDGGNGQDPTAVPPTTMTGAMWKVDHDFDFRFPIGAGTSPAPSSTAVAVGDTGGEENHLLTEPELPIHQFDITLRLSANTGSNTTAFFRSTAGPEQATASSDPVGGDVPHNNLPPYRGVFYIMRTGRQFYTA